MSLSLLFGHDEEVAHWVTERIPYAAIRIPYFPKGQVFGPNAALGVIDEQGALLAGVIYHAHDPFVRSIEVSCASDSPRWANREVFRTLLRYPFGQLQCQRITAATPRSATSTRQFLEGLGFKREGSLRRAFGDDAAIIYGLLREDWDAHPINRGRAPNIDAGVSRQ